MPILFCLSIGLLCGIAANAQEDAEPPPEKLHESSIGLSYLSYTGNSHGETLGFDMSYKRIPTPWGFEFVGKYLRTQDTGETTAEQGRIWIQGSRALGDRWEILAGALVEGDRFSGIDRRYMIMLGVRYKVLLGPKHNLRLDVGLTPVSEKYTDDTKRDYLGGLLSMHYDWNITDNSTFSQKLTWYPDLERNVNWRGESETSIKASITHYLALKVGYLVMYDNEPADGFKNTDSLTNISLVFTF